jgi:hypothetical protein
MASIDRTLNDNKYKDINKEDCLFISCAKNCLFTQSIVLIPRLGMKLKEDDSSSNDSNHVAKSSVERQKYQHVNKNIKKKTAEKEFYEFGRLVRKSKRKPITIPSENSLLQVKKYETMEFRRTEKLLTNVWTSSILSYITNITSRTNIHIQPLIILDLNGVLCHRQHFGRNIHYHKYPNSEIDYRNSVGYISNTSVITRTDLPAILKFLDQYFCLAIWTSAKIKTAKGLVNMLIPESIRKRLLFVWGQNMCDGE